MPILGSYYKAYLDPKEASIIPNEIGSMISAAKQSVDIAIYDIHHSSKSVSSNNPDKLFDFRIPEAISCAASRGVTIRLITDWSSFQKSSKKEATSSNSNFLDFLVTESIKNKNFTIQKRYPNQESIGIMHNKYIIIDNRAIWTGSYNWTTHSFGTNQLNNGIILVGKAIAESFLSDFNGMWNQKKAKGIDTTNQFLKVKDGNKEKSIRIGFSPTDNLSRLVIAHLEQAISNINMSIFSITDHDIKQTLIDRANAGVKVRIIGSAERTIKRDPGTFAVLTELSKINNIEVGLWKSKDSFLIMHLKSYSIDNKFFGIGSYNFTFKGLLTNDENHIVLDDIDLVQEYRRVFDTIWSTEIIAFDSGV